ncbi:MAG: radical SAM protein [Endomicrobiaceae bacterium]|jgi:MoaA/NifB/PqqE/SkfB family radical SAM enzyme|nr:radical SAM protein [Endomicrobiaceae bacterium]MDD3729411.1 radical SAM protein [Endomicrobiaceae bacterium]MDD4165437.1 radical SAM protein [Endomicrobiaceae bacterium]
MNYNLLSWIDMKVFEQINFFIQTKKYKEALDFLFQLLSEENKFDIHREIGKVYYSMGDYEKSLEYFLKIVNSEEVYNKNEIYFEIAKIYEITNQKQTAALYLEKILKSSKCEEVLLMAVLEYLVKIYKFLLEYDKAINLLNKFKKQSGLNNIDELLKDIYTELYQRFPGNYDFGGDYSRLIAIYKNALNSHPDNKQVLAFLAQVYNYLGMYDQTINLYLQNKDKMKDDLFFKNKFLNEYEIASKKTVLQSKPRNLMVVLSNKCNISCIMCLTSKSKWELPKERLEEIISMFPYLERIMWQGGEVLFLPYFKDILKKALQYPNMRQSMITNLQLADNETMELIVQNNIEVTVSIDGVSKNIYEKIRRGASFERLTDNINMLNAIRDKIKNKVILNMNVVVMNENFRTLSLFVDFAHKYRFDFICFMPIDYIPKNPTEKENNIKKEQDIFTNNFPDDIKELSFQMLLAEKKAKQFGIRIESRIKTTALTEQDIKLYDKHGDFSEQKLNVESQGFEENGKEKKQNEKNNIKENNENMPENFSKMLCHLPWYSLTFDFDGSVRPDCQCFIEKNIGHLGNETIEKLWNNEKMQIYRTTIINNRCESLCNENCILGRITEFHLKLL